MSVRWQTVLIVGVLATFLSLTFAAQPAQATHKSGAGKFIAGAIVGAIIVAALSDDDHHRRYYRCSYCGYHGPYHGKKWAHRYHSHGRKLILRTHRGHGYDGLHVSYHGGRSYGPKYRYGYHSTRYGGHGLFGYRSGYGYGRGCGCCR
ncbi:MAG: hypothetical protein ACE5R4_18205 [Armatimonadota bacterium]